MPGLEPELAGSVLSGVELTPVWRTRYSFNEANAGVLPLYYILGP